MQHPDFRHLAALLTHLSPGDLADVRKAYDFAVEAHAPQKREDGTPYVSHVIRVAEIVAEWKADRDTVIAALLHDVLEDTPILKEEIALKFGRKVAMLVEGITKFLDADLSPDLPLDRKIETLRKLFDVMRLDMRSILIKLADRLHNVQTIDSLPTPERRRRFALETLTVYYKIAFHLGLRGVRRTFAEFCVPHAFDTGESEKALRDSLCLSVVSVVGSVESELKKHPESYDLLSVTLFPRNLFIFHERMRERAGRPLPQDAFSLSVIVRTEDDCYQLLKTLHTLYRPLSGQFQDFIAAPSDAGYQSIHTLVSLQDGSVIEVRIRTPDMYEKAMKGITVTLFDPSVPDPPNFSWLKRSAELDLKTRDSSSAFWEALESDIFREMISINIDRKRISMPKGSTALDAAYAFHHDRASHTSAFTVNGRPVPGSEILKEDDEVHITIDKKQQHATFDWLQMVSTRHARLLIVDVLKKTEKTEKIALGATLLQKEFDHFNKGLLSELSRNLTHSVTEHFHRESFDQVLSMIGEGVIRARDIVFFLYPDKKNVSPTKPGRYSFQLHITTGEQPGQDILSQLDTVIRSSEVTINSINVDTHPNRNMSDIIVSGSSQDRLQFADFIDQLERQEWVSTLRTRISPKQKIILIGAFSASFAIIFLDLVLFPSYQQAFMQLNIIPRFIVQVLPLLPIFILNYYLLRLLRQYIVRMRSDRWFLSVGLLLNVIGLMLLVFRIVLLRDATASLLSLIAIFTFSMMYVGYAFFQTDVLFAPFDKRHVTFFSQKQWSTLKRRKIIGYSIRFVAVVIWGLEPVYIRYTPVNDLSPFLRTFLLGLGVVLPSAIFYFLLSLFKQRKLPSFRLPYDATFLLLVIGQVGYMYFKNASLIYTSGTNLLLFNNFSPLLGLIIAAFFWRRDIPYFGQARTMFWIFLLAIMAGIGSSLLAYGHGSSSTLSIVGDVLAMISTFFDVLMTIGQIQYIKKFAKTDGLLLNLHIFMVLLLCTAPVVLLASFVYLPLFDHLTPYTLLLGLGTGIFVGCGQLLNYAAFKRIDGYLAHMMFNLSVFITFSVEAFVIHSVQPTILLVIAGAIIIGASVFAEIINSRCQKKGL